MRVTSTGHAGLYVETAGGSILCDPWRNPAYFASWFPFPDNSGLDWDHLGQCDYLYVSHLHRDHFDPENLRRHVSKAATLLLPDFPVDELEVALRAVGFTKFETIPPNVAVELHGMRVMISPLTSPSDGPLGDSALAVDDGTAVILNQNDAHPFDFTALEVFAGDRAYDGHFLQYSGAIWWPVVYDLADGTKAAIAAEKRRNGMARALRYAEQLGAAFVFPNAGPPCFLDDDLRYLNDTHRDENNIFPDQTVFLRYLSERGKSNGRLLIPGSTAELHSRGEGGAATCEISHPLSDADVEAIFSEKEVYLKGYAGRQRSRIASEKASWAAPDQDVLAGLRAWIEPLLDRAVHFRAGVGVPVQLLVAGDPAAPPDSDRRRDLAVVVDFAEGVVRTSRAGERCRYRFRIGRPLVERLLADHEIDWSNSLFLSMRFAAHRSGPYNEFLYTFFKCLSLARIEYAEGWYSSREETDEETVLGDWCVQRRCPHLRADLARFGLIEGQTLTCRMHGWQWDLESGACLTAAGHPLRARPVEADSESTAGAGPGAVSVEEPEIGVPLGPLTSLRVGGPAGRLRRAATAEQIAAVLAPLPDRGPGSLLVLGGGTNVIIADDGFAGTVLLVEGGTIEARHRGADEVEWVVGAGVVWDDLVLEAVSANCCGIEMMSGIPGRVGAAPLQNIAAYGQQVCDVIDAVGVIDRQSLERRELTVGECEFGFRTSRFKREWRDRFVITHVRFRLPTAAARPPQPSRYVDLEKYFDRTGLSPSDLAARRQAVVDIRRTKSMLIDPDDPRSRSVGSFFVNPEVPVELARELTQRFKTIGLRVEYLEGHVQSAAPGTRQRIPAAHVLRFSGFNPGDRWGPVGLSDRHVLALVTYEGATALDVWRVGHFLRHRVLEATGVLLEFEAFFVGDFPEFDLEDFLGTCQYLPAAIEEPEWLASYR